MHHRIQNSFQIDRLHLHDRFDTDPILIVAYNRKSLLLHHIDA